MIHFEDLPVGRILEFGSHVVSRDEMLDYARQYDVQPFHLSDEEAAKTRFGRLAASGLLTASIAMGVSTRYLVAHDFQGQGSPGLEDLAWLHPVYADDRLRIVAEVTEARISQSKPGVGIVKLRTSASNQDGVEVMRFTGSVFVLRRRA